MHENIPEITIGYMLKDRLGQAIYGTNTHHYNKRILNAQQNDRFEISFTMNLNIGVGSYSVAVAAHSDESHLNKNYEWRDQVTVFNVVNSSKRSFVGSAWLEQKVEVQRVSS